MPNSIKLLAALPLVAGLLCSAAPTASATVAGGTVEGCPYGAVCIYPVNAGWNHGRPENRGIFWSYRVHHAVAVRWSGPPPG